MLLIPAYVEILWPFAALSVRLRCFNAFPRIQPHVEFTHDAPFNRFENTVAIFR
uniref:Secreted protein n=1 Tax=Ascaris lumbricoides TaxID=6252 RepID=A0A0M3HK58_ASCLU